MKLLKARDLSEKKSISQFLYKIYVKNLGWRPPENNPSHWKIEEENSDNPWFTDHFDRTSTWFATLNDENQIVSCCRVISPIEGKLEYELYTGRSQSIPNSSVKLELNRFAVEESYFNSTAPIFLLMAVLEHCLISKVDHLILPAPESISHFCSKLGFESLNSPPFKYSGNDPSQTHLQQLNFTDKTHIEKVHREWRNLLSS